MSSCHVLWHTKTALEAAATYRKNALPSFVVSHIHLANRSKRIHTLNLIVRTKSSDYLKCCLHIGLPAGVARYYNINRPDFRLFYTSSRALHSKADLQIDPRRCGEDTQLYSSIRIMSIANVYKKRFSGSSGARRIKDEMKLACARRCLGFRPLKLIIATNLNFLTSETYAILPPWLDRFAWLAKCTK